MRLTMTDDPSVKFGEFVLKLLVEAHKQGGIALAVLLVGTVCMVFAFMLANTANTIAAYSLLAVGALCILAVITIIYYLVILPTQRVVEKARQNQDTINSVQEVALQATKINADLTDYVLVHTQTLAQHLDLIKLVIEKLPLGKSVTESPAFANGHQFAQSLVAYARRGRDVGADLHEAIKNADAAKIKVIASDLIALKGSLKLLNAPRVDKQ
jgi:hypothetical protein